MKWIIKYISVACLVLVSIMAVPQKAAAQDDEITFQDFYDQLSPYGTWVDDPDHGTVWVPDVDQNFKPYATNGHWAMTEYGNTWVSDYEWGWAPFHYGRWKFDDYYGWEWIPDYEWGPAWVDWRSGDNYYGWAPLGPDASLDDAYYYANEPSYDYWTFAPQMYIYSPVIYNYYVPRARFSSFFGRTVFINNFYNRNNSRYVCGPRRIDIERATRSRVTVYNIRNISRPSRNYINNTTINIYRPQVRRADNARPNRVVDGRAYRNANPGWNIGNRSGRTNRPDNAARLANVARGNDAANRNIVRVNNDNNRPGGRPERGTDRVPNRTRDEQDNRRRQQDGQQVLTDQQIQQRREDANTRREQQGNDNRGRPSRPNQGQMTDEQRQQQADQRRQQMEQRRQQRDQQNQQLTDEQRQQQADQRRQQMEQRRQQRDQQNQQQTDQQRQQQADQRRQEMEQRRQQRDQQDAQQRQQQDQQRQQQAEQQRQQQDQQRQQQQEQRRQQQEQQRQQQQEQQRQQQEQQRQQRPVRP